MTTKNTLMIVESPAKAKTIGKLLGKGTTVLASMGHVRDLHPKQLAVDVAHDFRPTYALTPKGMKVVPKLKEAARKADQIFLATDPDREGEAIAWHLQSILQDVSKADFYRIAYHEITRSAIEAAFRSPGQVKQPLVDAQQARRVLDRLVGYQVSPMLWKDVEKETSAGRVQSVALRLIVDREREIQAFQPVEYWNLEAVFSPASAPQVRLKTTLSKLNGKKANVPDGTSAQALGQALEDGTVSHQVSSITSKRRTQRPAPPFTTSTLQQAAGSALRFGSSTTMSVAQQLYEGVDLGGTTSGLITYMRTDSVHVASEAQQAALGFIRRTYGAEYAPATPNRFASGKNAQEAHEAIRPTNVERTPEEVAPYLDDRQRKLYRLIWNRFVASQMASAQQVDHAIEILSRGGALETLSLPCAGAGRGVECVFRAAARETLFPGYQKVYNMKDLGQEDEMDNLMGSLPALTQGDSCRLQELKKEQCFTQPPKRFSEGALVKALEANGVGRPSTFASTVQTILDRHYVEKQQSSALVPTERGFRVNDYLVERFPELFDVDFTARMEKELDQVEEGKMEWVSMIREFYEKFQGWLALGGALPQNLGLSRQQWKALLEAFPEDFPFDPPVTGPRRTYDDAKFTKSLRNILAKSPEKFTERQASAMLAMVARYAERHPELKSLAGSLGLGESLEAYRRDLALKAERRQNAPEKLAVEPALTALLKAMETLEFEAPVTRRRHEYNDGRFFHSLAQQATVSGGLSGPQREALRKLALKYAPKIPGFPALAEQLGWTAAPEKASPAAQSAPDGETAAPAPGETPQIAEQVQQLLTLTEAVRQWNPPVKRGKVSYDDKKFVDSLKEQWRKRGSLTERQLAAWTKTLARYQAQLPPGSLEKLQGAAPAPGGADAAPEPVENCPLCGKPLKRIHFRGRSFLGCSGYPQCHFTKNG
ncbi:MAG: type I DNA topoisomerase [Oligosphaeraceae bacterium]